LHQALKDLVRSQLADSISVMQSVMDDTSISEAIVSAGEITAAAMKSGHKLMVAGNGGSAADSQHIAAEFVSRVTVDRPALRAIALTVDSSILTAIGNDYGYGSVFERQVEALGQPGDVFLAISASGNSENVIRALKRARALGLTTIGLTGNGGGAMRGLCDHMAIVPSTSTMNIQESHLALEHIFCMVVEHCYFGTDFGAKHQGLSK
jgi:D-sedoheptulose 7-phosphate isomerase